MRPTELAVEAEAMIEEQDFPRIREYIIRILPELLRKEPEIGLTIEGMLAEQFPRRDEFARLLDELAQTRGEMTQRFDGVDQRFDGVEQRFDGVEQRFDGVEQRFDGVEQRFGGVEQHLEQVDGTLLGLRRDMAGVKHGQEMLLQRFDGQQAWINFVTGNLGVEKGETLENLFAAALRFGLNNPDITLESIRLRQKLVDRDGQVFRKGFATEVDLIAEDGRLTVFEVKATARASDVGIFALKVELLAAQNPDRTVRGVFIAPAAGDDVRRLCAEHGLDLVV